MTHSAASILALWRFQFVVVLNIIQRVTRNKIKCKEEMEKEKEKGKGEGEVWRGIEGTEEEEENHDQSCGDQYDHQYRIHHAAVWGRVVLCDGWYQYRARPRSHCRYNVLCHFDCSQHYLFSYLNIIFWFIFYDICWIIVFPFWRGFMFFSNWEQIQNNSPIQWRIELYLFKFWWKYFFRELKITWLQAILLVFWFTNHIYI